MSLPENKGEEEVFNRLMTTFTKTMDVGITQLHVGGVCLCRCPCTTQAHACGRQHTPSGGPDCRLTGVVCRDDCHLAALSACKLVANLLCTTANAHSGCCLRAMTLSCAFKFRPAGACC
jgi:hypothetical protein